MISFLGFGANGGPLNAATNNQFKGVIALTLLRLAACLPTVKHL